MPTLTLTNQSVFYTVRKGHTVEAPALLLIHGAGGTHLDWPVELHRLPNATVYALDLPGHGRSEPPGRDTIEGYTDVVEQFIQKLVLKQVFVAGHSMGGAITLTLGLRNNSWLTGLVLIGTGARLRVMDTILRQTLSNFPAVAQIVTDNIWAPGAPEEVVSLARQRLAANDPQVVLGDFQACNQFDITGQLHALMRPTLIISATADRMTPLKYGQYLANQIPEARLVTVEGSGHMMTLEQPQLIAAAVQAFIEENSTSSG